MSDEIRTYVADLAAYNTGYLHGVWIDACYEPDDIETQIKCLPAQKALQRCRH